MIAESIILHAILSSPDYFGDIFFKKALKIFDNPESSMKFVILYIVQTFALFLVIFDIIIPFDNIFKDNFYYG